MTRPWLAPEGRQNPATVSGVSDPVGERAKRPRISVVIPVLNGENQLTACLDRLVKALERVDGVHEVILVDDGSRDGTWDQMVAATADRPIVRAIRLARNVGQATAVAAGFADARGEIVAMLDVDLEAFPEDLPTLIAAVEGGADLAAGRRTTARRVSRQLPSKLFNWHAKRMGLPYHDIGCGMNVMTRRVATEYINAGPPRRGLVRPLLHSLAPVVVEVPVRSERPVHSSLSLGDLVTLWLDFDATLRRPPWARLALVGTLGFSLACIELAIALVWRTPSPTLLLVALALVTALIGLLLVALGLFAGLVLRHLLGLAAEPFRVVDRAPQTEQKSERAKEVTALARPSH